MIFPVKVYDKDGNFKKEISAKQLREEHWKGDKNPIYNRFSEGAYQSVKYAERSINMLSDYIPSTDNISSKNKTLGNFQNNPERESTAYNSMIKNGNKL